MSNAVLSQEQLETYWVGMDVAKATFDVGLACPGQHYPQTPLREIPTASFARTPEGAGKFLVWLDKQVGAAALDAVRVIMEATGRYSAQLTQWLAAARPSLGPAIVNPARTSAYIKSLGLRNKTDRLEARALAFYGVERRPAPYALATPAWVQLRELSRYRYGLVRRRVAEENRANEGSESALVRQIEKRRLSQFDRDIQKIEKQIRKLVRATPELKKDVEALESIKGVGFVTATTVLAELGDLRRFHRARQLTAFAGLSPCVRESGDSVHGRPHLCKQGNPRVRQVLYLATLAHIRKDSQLTQTYIRLCDAGKAPMEALCAVMRKLLTVMRAILISGKPYESNYQRNRTAEKTCG